MRIVSTSFDGHRYVAHLQRLRGRTCIVRASVPFAIDHVPGAEVTRYDTGPIDLSIAFEGDGDWVAKDLVVDVGRRIR